MKKPASTGINSVVPLVLGSLLVFAGGIQTSMAQSAAPGRPVTVGEQGGTIDTDGSDDTFSAVTGGNMLTVTNSNASKGSSLNISGPGDRVGGLSVAGAHTKVVFSGPGATVFGPVIITNRTNSLHFNGDDTQVNGPVSNYGALVFGQAGSATISGTISGTGKVVQRGPGVTTIMGSNTYSGGTVIEHGGTVVVSNNRNLGAPDAPVVLNGGTLRTTGNVQPSSYAAQNTNQAAVPQPAGPLTSADKLNQQELQSLSGGSAPVVPTPVPVPPPVVPAAVPAPPPAGPVWTLSAGRLIGKQIRDWGQTAGWRVVWDARQDWVVASSTKFSGDFQKAASQVLEYMAGEGAPVRGTFYTGNHTLVVRDSSQ